MRHKIYKYLVSLIKFGFITSTIILIRKLKKAGLIKLDLPQLKHPLFLRCNSSDLLNFDEIFIEGEYDLNIILKSKFAQNYKAKFIIDAGANIGMTALYFKQNFPEATIVCLEPESSNFNVLVKNTEKYEGIICRKEGLWSQPTNLEIVDNNNGNWGFNVKEVTVESINSIKATSINEILKEYGVDQIDLIKIDIEGSEFEVFSHNFNTWLPKVKALLIEIHDEINDNCSKSFFRALSEYHFTVIPHGVNFICIRID